MKTVNIPDIGEFETSKTPNGLSFEWSQMYECPELTFPIMKAISDFFGTESINFENDIHSRGCSTCDYGSSYGFTVTIINPTKNNPYEETK